MKEPPRESDLSLLVPYVRERVERILAAMERRGFHPFVVESWRSHERQVYLYAIGRTIRVTEKPVTWTLNGSLHLKRKAVDIADRKTGYKDMRFFRALKVEGEKQGLTSLAPREWCHLQYE